MDPAASLALDEHFANITERDHIPGIAYGLVVDGMLAHCAGAGRVALEHGDAPDADTRYRIASMTKSFTAAAIVSLRDDGALALDDEIARYVPELAELRGPTTDSPALTIRHLLTMAGGQASDDPWADRLLDAESDTMDRLFRAGATFAAAPGTELVYSNYGYAMLGRAISNVTGQPFQDFITERLLRPLGMPATTWTPPTDGNGADHSQVAPGYRRYADGSRAALEPLGDGGFAAMGGLWSTVRDLARWVAWFADAFPPRDDTDDRPLRRASRREMQQVHRDRPPTIASSADGTRVTQTGYGYGLFVGDDSRLGAFAAHSGGLPGYGSNMRWLRDRHVGVIALANLTYARMTSATLAALDALFDRGLLPEARHTEHSGVVQAGHRLVDLLGCWDDDRADELFAFNVFLDDDLATRRDATDRAQRESGPFSVASITALNACEADVMLLDRHGARWKLALMLSPEVPPRVQWYELEAIVTTGE